jgi:hypothetical protein
MIDDRGMFDDNEKQPDDKPKTETENKIEETQSHQNGVEEVKEKGKEKLEKSLI